MKSGICLQSETGEPECVTIDAEQLGRVIYCEDVDSTTTFEGLTMTAGLAVGSWPDCAGGGMCCENSSPRVVRCRFVDNSAVYDGGMSCLGACHTYLSDVGFSGNSAEIGAGAMGLGEGSSILVRVVFEGNSAGDCGALAVGDGPTTLVGCTFSGNTATSDESYGGAVYAWSAELTCVGTVFLENSASHGGAIYLDGSSAATVTQCTFAGNEAEFGGGIAYIQSRSIALAGCVFSGNTAQWVGGAFYEVFSGENPTMTGCTFCYNAAPNYSAICSNPTMQNCIVAFNTGGDPLASGARSCCDFYGNTRGDERYPCLYDQQGVNGNFSADPLFCDPLGGDFHIDCNSPCAPGNHPTGYECGLVGALGVGCGASRVESTTWGGVKAMYR
jgi:predicted outer membrane repeat protein